MGTFFLIFFFTGFEFRKLSDIAVSKRSKDHLEWYERIKSYIKSIKSIISPTIMKIKIK